MTDWEFHLIPQILSGDVAQLDTAFHWASAPQGYFYWYDRCEGLVPLSDKDRAFLEKLYADAVKRRLKL